MGLLDKGNRAYILKLLPLIRNVSDIQIFDICFASFSIFKSLPYYYIAYWADLYPGDEVIVEITA